MINRKSKRVVLYKTSNLIRDRIQEHSKGD